MTVAEEYTVISVGYVQMMARYNGWQNGSVIAAAETLPSEEIHRDRGAFFGSLLGTLNHLLWADRLWMTRLDGWKRPDCGIADSTTLYPTLAAWKADRMRADGRIRLWARNLRPAGLRGTATWISGALGREMSQPIATCVVHMFNHQTHHRGQVHALLTAAGATTQDTDLVFMPDDV